MKLLKFLSKLMFLFVLLLIFSCGENKNNKQETKDKKEKSTEAKTYTGCADFANLKGHKLQSAIVLDFVNVSNSAEFESLSVQIADNIYREVNRCFSIIDNGYVRDYVKDKNIPKDRLSNKEIAKEIGIHFSADLVIYGTYTIAGSEIQIIGEVSSVEKGGAYNDFKITGEKDKILGKLDMLSQKVSNIAATTFPPQKINEKLIEKEATSVVTIIKVVEAYQKNESVSKKSKPKPDDQTLEQKPDPRPKWTWQVPLPDTNIYFVGQAMEQSSFNEGLDGAIKDAYLSMSRAVGKQIESVYSKKTYRGSKGSYEELTGKLIVKTLNYVRGEQLWKKYWRKLKDGTYEVCVLFKLSFADLRKNIAESVNAEAERLKEATAIAEAEKSKARTAELKAQLELLKKIEAQKAKIGRVKAEIPKYVYSESNTTVTSDHLSGQKDSQEPAETSFSGDKAGMVFIKGGIFWMGCHEASKVASLKQNKEESKFRASLIIPIVILLLLLAFGVIAYRKNSNIFLCIIGLCMLNVSIVLFVMCGGSSATKNADKLVKGADTAPEEKISETPADWYKNKKYNSGGVAEKLPDSTNYGSDCDDDEKPAHKVTVSDFFMDETEVTTADFEAYINSHSPSTDYYVTSSGNSYCNINLSDGVKDNHPVNCVNWILADDYCRKLGKRLPTETEWEYAAGNGSKHTKWSLGNSFNKDDYCFDRYGDGKENTTCPIKSYKANDFGLYDMSGNVWEWCQDWYKEDFYMQSGIADPVCNNDTSVSRVLRGGSWLDYDFRYLRSSDRDGTDPDLRYSSVGFRCSLSN